MKTQTMRAGLLPIVAVVAAVVGASCASDPVAAPGRSGDEALSAGDEGLFAVDNAPKRPFFVHVPAAYDGETPLPVLFALHAGGGRIDTLRSLTCPGGNTGDDGCLTAVADRDDTIVVMPSGTGAIFLDDSRTWNAGGGDTMRCVSGRACQESVDDVSYIDAVLNEVDRALAIDHARLFVAGMSNGAAMAHRLACERSTVFAAVGAVAGANQLRSVDGCHTARPMPVLQIHGDEDPCWGMDGASGDGCVRDDAGPLVGVTASMEGWRLDNACQDTVDETDLDDDADDGTTTTRRRFEGCLDGADVELMLVHGGGHTWPGGNQYAGEDSVGRTARDFAANTALLDFFAAHPLPDALLATTTGGTP